MKALVRSTKPKASLWRRILGAIGKRAVVWADQNTSSGATPFAGARISRLFMDWVTSNLSADKDVQGSLLTLRARSRDLVRNSAYAKRFLQLLRANVVGPMGIRLQARIRSEDGRPFTTVNAKIEEAWAEWGKRCSADGRYSWRDVQGLLVTGMGQDGEFIIRFVRGFDNPFGFAIQLIDPDLLDSTFNVPRGTNQNEVRMGVEIDQWGKPIAYWLWDRHPSETGIDRKRERIPASDILHDFVPLRVNQSRGLPWFHPVLVSHQMLEGYQEAELIAARVAAAKPGFFQKSLDAPEVATQDEAVDDLPMEVEPGTFHELPPGYTFQGFDPQHPTEAYKDFVSAILRAISAGLGVSYHSLANDLSGVNYSSARVGELADRDEWRAMQQWMIEHVHSRIYEEWLKMALLAGALPGLSLNHRQYLRIAWRPRGWAWVDPQNELTASEKELQLGLNSRTRQAAEQGRDFEEILEDLAEEQKLIAEHGLTIGQPVDNAKPESGDEVMEDSVERSRITAQVDVHTAPPDMTKVAEALDRQAEAIRAIGQPVVHVAAPNVTNEVQPTPVEVRAIMPAAQVTVVPKTGKRTVKIKTPKGEVSGEIEEVA